MAVRASIARIAEIDSGWRDATVVARPVKTDAPAMPLTDWELMSGAPNARWRARPLVPQSSRSSILGLEGGFHSISVDGEWHRFCCWAYGQMVSASALHVALDRVPGASLRTSTGEA